MQGQSPTRLLSLLSGVLLSFILFFAPLAWACSRPQPMEFLILALHITGLLWACGIFVERRRANISLLAGICVAGFLIYAWLRYLFVPAESFDAFTAWHLGNIFARWPESMIERTPFNITGILSGCLIAFTIVCDLSARPFWRKVFCFTLIASGLCVILLGLIQNYTQAPGIYWQSPKTSMPSLFFGPFYHFTSAGAFINLTWPIAGSLALFYFARYITRHTSLVPALLWGALTELMLLGHAGHVSRVPQVIAAIALLCLLLIHRFPLRFHLSKESNIKEIDPSNINSSKIESSKINSQNLPSKVTSYPFTVTPLSHAKALVLLFIGAISLIGGYWIVSHTGRLHNISSRWKIFSVGMPDFISQTFTQKFSLKSPQKSSSNPTTKANSKDSTKDIVKDAGKDIGKESEGTDVHPHPSLIPHDPALWPPLMRDDLFLPSDHSNFFLNDRGASYVLALRSIGKKPLIGYGAGGWTAAASQNSTDPLLRTFFHYLQFTHEDYLQTAVEFGLVGFSLLAVLIGSSVIIAWRRVKAERNLESNITPQKGHPRSMNQALTIGALAAVCAVLLQSLYDFPLQIPANTLYLFALVGILWSSEKPE